MLKDENVSRSKDSKSPNHKRYNGDYRVHKPYDKYFKNMMSIAGEGFMKLIGYPIGIKQVHNTEKINEISGELHIDSLIESYEPKMYINEFQTGPISDRDLRRFGSYQVLVYKETGLETLVNIISLEAKHDSDDLYGFGNYFNRNYSNNNPPIIEYGFTPHVKSLTDMDLSLYLNIMEEIVETKKKPDEYDLAILLTVPFMTDHLEKRKELIFKTDEIASKLNILDKNLWIDIKNNQRLLAQEVLNDGEFQKFVEVRKVLSEEDLYKLDKYEDMMRERIILEKYEEKGLKKGEERGMKKGEERGLKKGEERGMKKGEERGLKKGEEKVVKKLLEDGFKVEDVLRYTSLKKSQVIALSNALVLK